MLQSNMKADASTVVGEKLILDRMCRVCMETCCDDDKEFIFATQPITDIDAPEVTSIADCINQCTNVEAITEHDGLPQHICRKCHQMLGTAVRFKQLCERSDQEMRARNGWYQEWLVKQNTTEYVTESDTEEGHEAIVQDPIVEDHADLRIEFIDPFSDDTHSVNALEEPSSQADDSDDNSIMSIAFDGPSTDLDTVHQCPTCDMRCYTADVLERHMKSHLRKKPFICDYCKKGFRTRMALDIHFRSHTDERPFVCEMCGNAFKTRSALSCHRVTHTETRDFPCVVCPYRGGSVANLRIHERSHSKIQPYACPTCPQKFSTSSNLAKHVRNIHKKQKPHGCEHCDRTFFTRESARKHSVTHTGRRPYKCVVCTLDYSWYNGLQKHMHSQHVGCPVPSEKYFVDKMLEESA